MDETQKKLKVAVLGGTGRAGKYVVEELLNQGFKVRMLSRNPARIVHKDPGIEVIIGSARNYANIQRLLAGCNAVISTLGPSKGETNINSVATGHVIKVMRNLKLKRYIEIAGWGINAAGDEKGRKTRLVGWIIRTLFPEKANDRQKVYEMLKRSNLDWTIVRCPSIEFTNARRHVHTELTDSPGNKVSVSDLAAFLVEQLNDTEFFRKCPFISS